MKCSTYLGWYPVTLTEPAVLECLNFRHKRVVTERLNLLVWYSLLLNAVPALLFKTETSMPTIAGITAPWPKMKLLEGSSPGAISLRRNRKWHLVAGISMDQDPGGGLEKQPGNAERWPVQGKEPSFEWWFSTRLSPNTTVTTQYKYVTLPQEGNDCKAQHWFYLH